MPKLFIDLKYAAEMLSVSQRVLRSRFLRTGVLRPIVFRRGRGVGKHLFLRADVERLRERK